jgi:uncharacterized protein YbaR (Trm112 family)
MSMNTDTVSVLVCPKCHSGVLKQDGGMACGSCQLVYPIRNGIPVMIVAEAKPLSSNPQTSQASTTKGEILLNIIGGPDEGMVIPLARNRCCAIGRSIENTDKTQTVSVGTNLGLDQTIKELVLNYVTKTMHPDPSVVPSSDALNIGGFERMPDLVLSDTSVSRLHAMLFHGPSGVGVLDLVSKNGTFVNGTEVESMLLHPGDTITIGSSRIQYQES